MTNKTSINLPSPPPAFCVAEWLASDEQLFAQWMAALRSEAVSTTEALHPVVNDFQQFVVANPAVLSMASQMLEQVPQSEHYSNDPTGNPQLRSFGDILKMISVVLRTPPAFNQTGITGLPINAMFAWCMATPAGHAFFHHPQVNQFLKRILQEWGHFLTTAASLPALGNDPRSGWFGADAMAYMPDFDQEFECDASLPYRGFRSWDDFFTRRFRPCRRPVAAPDDDGVVINACEAAPFRLVHGARLHDRFWIKAQPYSLQHMLGGDPVAGRFDGGTVYQAFLSSFSYHRWHSPVSGRIVGTRVIDGGYYAQSREAGFDPCGPRKSQAYITQVATRALIFIEAAHPGIGLMCFMAVGMAEVSTCDVTVVPGQQIAKGDQLGMFHFGGSTHCLLFRPEAKLDFDLHGQTPGLDAHNIHINQRIATVIPPR